MKCILCDNSFKLSKLQVSSNVCLDCSGVTDDLDVPDEELKIDLWIARNPSGKTPVVRYDMDTEMD